MLTNMQPPSATLLHTRSLHCCSLDGPQELAVLPCRGLPLCIWHDQAGDSELWSATCAT